MGVWVFCFGKFCIIQRLNMKLYSVHSYTRICIVYWLLSWTKQTNCRKLSQLEANQRSKLTKGMSKANAFACAHRALLYRKMYIEFNPEHNLSHKYTLSTHSRHWLFSLLNTIDKKHKNRKWERRVKKNTKQFIWIGCFYVVRAIHIHTLHKYTSHHISFWLVFFRFLC